MPSTRSRRSPPPEPAREKTDWLRAKSLDAAATLRETLAACNGNISEAARVLGIVRTHATKLMRRYKLQEYAGNLRVAAGCTRQPDGRVLGRLPGT